jgi:hypothetical protein
VERAPATEVVQGTATDQGCRAMPVEGKLTHPCEADVS